MALGVGLGLGTASSSLMLNIQNAVRDTLSAGVSHGALG